MSEYQYLREQAAGVLENIPRAFGTFQKAKYVLESYAGHITYYFFTTTVYSEREAVQILINMQKELYHYDQWFKIRKITTNSNETLYTNKNVIDTYL